MKLRFHISLRNKIIFGVLIIFIFFLGISVFSLINNMKQQELSAELKENIQIQNYFTDIKNIVFKDFQLTDELIEKSSESEFENKWKDHEFFVAEINKIFNDFDSYSIENIDLAGIVSIYQKQMQELYNDLHKKKLKEIILTMSDSTSHEIKITENEIADVKKELKDNVAILNIKVEKNEETVKENILRFTDTQYDSFEKHRRYLIIMNIAALIILFIYLYALLTVILSSVKKLNEFVSKLKHGVIPDALILKTNDEIETITENLSQFTTSVKKVSDALDEIGQNNFNNQYTLLSDQDQLGNSYEKMKKNLMERNEEARKMKEQEDIQNWSTIGIAKFGNILRQQTENNEELAYNIIKALIEYVDANQGGVFIVNDEDESEPLLELMSTYAYGRRKFKQRKIQFGEGLVGTTALEGQSTYLTNLPGDYMEIESYLGHSSPKSLLLVPLKVDDKVFGIIEIASFNEFKPHEIKFIEDLAETIASTLATAKINAKTAELLEKSREQSEAMLAQEEEMRQNLEELQSTQEEAARREKLLQEELEELRNLQEENEILRKEINELKKKN